MNLMDLIPYDEILSLIFTLIHILIYFSLSVLFQTLQMLFLIVVVIRFIGESDMFIVWHVKPLNKF